MANPTLSGLVRSVTFLENTVNATPQLIDTDVTFSDADNNFNGATITISGVLGEDRIAVRNQGTGGGQIGVSGANISFGGTTIGSFTGGVGGTFTVTLNASASSAAVDALLQNLTYANVSDTPTASRTLRVQVQDAAGDKLLWTPLTGAENPFNGFDTNLDSTPTFLDLNNDGRLDLLAGSDSGTTLHGQTFAYRNNGDGTFTPFVTNPINGGAAPDSNLSAGTKIEMSAPSAVDWDGDGDTDLVLGEYWGSLEYFKNNGDGTFTEQNGAANPFNSVMGASYHAAANFFINIDGDGDFDLMRGDYYGGAIHAYRNDGGGNFTELTGGSNPFNGINMTIGQRPVAVDYDGDGDLDVVIGNGGALRYLRNNGGSFTELTGNANPFNGLALGGNSAPAFADIDGDGDKDLVVGQADGTFRYYRNDTNGAPLVVNVTAEPDNTAPVIDLNGAAGGTGNAVSYTENGAPLALAPSGTVTDAESPNFDTGTLTVSYSANGAAEDRLTVVHVGNGAGQIGVSGSAVSFAGTQFATFTGGTGTTPLVFTFDADATPAAVQALLRQIAYSNVSEAPSTATRGVNFVVTDGDGGTSAIASATVGVTSVNDAPTATILSGDTATWFEGSSSAAMLDVGSDGTIADVDSVNFDTGTLTVHIGTGLVAAQDQLVIVPLGPVTFTSTTVSVGGTQIATYTGGGAGGSDLVFTFDSDATPAAVQSLMRAIAFTNTGGDNPTAGPRAITWTFNDGDGSANGGNPVLSVSTSVTVVGINDAPSGTNATVTIAEDATYVFHSADFGFSDVDGNALTHVQITTLPGAGTLYYDPDGPGGLLPITFSPGAAFTVAQLDAGSVYFVPEAEASGAGYASFAFQVVDNGGTANGGVNVDPSLNTILINVTPVNDAPVQTLPPIFAGIEDTSLVLTGLSLADADAGGADVMVTLSVTTGTLSLATSVLGGLTAGQIVGNGTSSISILAPIAAINATLADAAGLSFTPVANGTGADTLTMITNDLGNSGGLAQGDIDAATITLAPVDDDATVAPDSASVLDNATVAISVLANDSDIDSPLVIATIAGTPVSVGVPLALASGATVTLNGDGTITYDPNGAFDYLVSAATAAATGATDFSAQDSFTYALADGSSTTVTVTVNGTDGVDDELHGSNGNDTITGTAGDDTVLGFDGNDKLIGGLGADTLIGGDGDDWYYVDNPGDTVTELAGEGADRVLTSVSYTLGAGVAVERLTTSDNFGTAPLDLTGNELDNVIYGNAGNNVLSGMAGNDILIGLGGIDTLVGGTGNDWHYVDSADDIVVEGAAEGASDRVFASVSYTLGAGVYVEMFTTNDSLATTAIDLTGNELANLIYGNAGANVLDGKAGADTLVGFGGDDWYYVDSALDVINETVGGGTDRVLASVSYRLGTGVQVEQLSTADDAGTTAINLTGNELANAITGNAGVNVLDGKGGADTMSGLQGNDWYYVDNLGDVVTEIAGGGTNDRVFASLSYTLGAGSQVEMFTTSDNLGTAAIDLTGNELANLVYGNAGDNVLDGKAGIDSLTGMGGADSFAFTTALGAGNVDYISDFNVADDSILLDDAVFAGLSLGLLAAGAFNMGSAATEADDRIIYNAATGALLFDADGLGGAAAVQFATLSTGLALTGNDFAVI